MWQGCQVSVYSGVLGQAGWLLVGKCGQTYSAFQLTDTETSFIQHEGITSSFMSESVIFK